MDSLLSYRNCIDRPERAFILALGYSREEMRGSLSHILKDSQDSPGWEGGEGRGQGVCRGPGCENKQRVGCMY